MKEHSVGFKVARLYAENEARYKDFPEVTPEHLWIALCQIAEMSDLGPRTLGDIINAPFEDSESLSIEIQTLSSWLRHHDITTSENISSLRDRLATGPGISGKIQNSSESEKVYELIAILAQHEKSKQLTTIHLVEALFDNPTQLLGEVLGKSEPQFSEEILGNLGRNLTILAREGKLNPVIGRKVEKRRLAQVLIQPRKANAILVGDSGVGKTAVVEGLAQKIVAPNCPKILRNIKIIEISLSSLVAGAKFRGDLEKRLEEIINEAESNPDLILFIDEIHTIMGIGKGYGDSSGIVSILKPSLERGTLRIIGATTTEEYYRYIVKDRAFTRRFEIIWLEEPTGEETFEILKGIRSTFEKHYGITIQDEALKAAIDFSTRFIADRRLPDKAIDLVNQACSLQAIKTLTITVSKSSQVFSSDSADTRAIEAHDIARVISSQCRVPLDLLTMSDKQRLGHLEDFLSGRIIGQNKAICKIVTAMRAAYRGLKFPRRPIASFLFAGPTGTGKTETARVLAEYFFLSSNNFIRFDMSEYMEKHQVSRLIGAPPGYVGHEDEGQLTRAVRSKPASLILFDEIEKAHSEVLNLLLQILEEGTLTDGTGRHVSFRETIIILTTNLGQRHDAHKEEIGFQPDISEGDHSPQSDEETYNILANDLAKHLKPELLGRIKTMVLFQSFQKADIPALVDKIIFDFLSNLRAKGVDFAVLPEVRQRIIEKVNNLHFGARDIEHIVENELGTEMERSDSQVFMSREPENDNESSESEADDVLFTVMQTGKPMSAALLVLDIVESSNLVLKAGDTFFCNLIKNVYIFLKSQKEKRGLSFLKCTGDGYLAVYRDVDSAIKVARKIMMAPIWRRVDGSNVGIRIAIHYGKIKCGPSGDPLGVNVHIAFRLEGIQEKDRLQNGSGDTDLPASGRILLTTPAAKRLRPSIISQFKNIGKFRIKGFTDPVEVWLDALNIRHSQCKMVQKK